jgi:hypothetical protein
MSRIEFVVVLHTVRLAMAPHGVCPDQRGRAVLGRDGEASKHVGGLLCVEAVVDQ